MTKCEVDGCTAEANHYEIYGYDPVPEFNYCDKHAFEAGFCPVCGGFYGGTEEFFRSNCPGMCVECCDELEDALNWGDDDDEDYDDYDMEDM